MNKTLKFLLAALGIIQLGVTGGDAGGADRGDNFTPTDDVDGEGDTPDVKAKTKAEPEPAAKAEPEPAAKAEPEPAKADKRIPLDRHEAILAKERAARQQVEAQLAEVRGGQRVADTNAELSKLEDEVVKLEAQYAKLVIDGEPKEAARVMAEIRAKERIVTRTQAQFETQAAEARAYERARYDAVVDRLEVAYPQLNPDAESFDEDLSDAVMTMASGYQARGLSRVDALQKAVKAMIKPETVKQTKAVDTDARPSAEDVAAKLAAERKAAAVGKNIDAANKTPANLAHVGMDNDKAGGRLDGKAVMKMSQDQFSKLDDETLSKLRGDSLV